MGAASCCPPTVMIRSVYIIPYMSYFVNRSIRAALCNLYYLLKRHNNTLSPLTYWIKARNVV